MADAIWIGKVFGIARHGYVYIPMPPSHLALASEHGHEYMPMPPISRHLRSHPSWRWRGWSSSASAGTIAAGGAGLNSSGHLGATIGLGGDVRLAGGRRHGRQATVRRSQARHD